MGDLVRYEATEGVAHIQLNRPEAANAFDLEMSRALGAAVTRAADDPEVRAVLVTGAGSRFCAGGDVASFIAADDQAAYLHALALHLDGVSQALAAMSKPVVAAVHGAVAGAGLALMLSCDAIVAAQGTKFVFAYPGVGLTPDCGLSYLLPRAIGQQRALGFALSGHPVEVDQALGWGLITELADNATARGRDIARTWASGPADALGQTSRLLRAGWELDRSSAGSEEAQTISKMVRGQEAQSLIARFVNR